MGYDYLGFVCFKNHQPLHFQWVILWESATFTCPTFNNSFCCSFVRILRTMKVINRVTPLRVSPEEEQRGLDESEFGEHSYYPRSGD